MIASSQREVFFKKAAMALYALVVVACLFLVFGRSGDGAGGAPVSASGKWTCSMCPQFILPEPGKCPKCFMDLIPLEEGAGGGSRLELYLTPEAAELAEIRTEAVEMKKWPGDDGAADGVTAVIPAAGIMTSRGRSFAYVESMEEEYLVYTLREIRLAGGDGKSAAIASGLEEGDIIAVSGLFRIDSAMQILGKTSLANLPDGELTDAEGGGLPPYQPAERSAANIRAENPAVDAWFDKYEQIRAALARDENDGANAPSRELAALLSEAGTFSESELNGMVARLGASSGDLSGAMDLSARRAAFEKVTADMVLLARGYGSAGDGLNLVFCPMAFGGAGAYWLQPGETVDNPYHGLEMPLCGWLVDSIAPFASGDGDTSLTNQD